MVEVDVVVVVVVVVTVVVVEVEAAVVVVVVVVVSPAAVEAVVVVVVVESQVAAQTLLQQVRPVSQRPICKYAMKGTLEMITDHLDTIAVVAGSSRGQFGCGQAIPGRAPIPGSSIRKPWSTLGVGRTASRSNSIGGRPALSSQSDLRMIMSLRFMHRFCTGTINWWLNLCLT